MRRISILKGIVIITIAILLGVSIVSFTAENKMGTGDFTFVQLSDTHWGFNNEKINPDFAGTLKKAVDEVNTLATRPDFIMFTGDLTQTTDDPKIRRQRMSEFKDIIRNLKVANVHFIPGEHDASLDNGKAFKEFFGKTYYTFDYKGVHFIALDNVSDPEGKIGDVQLKWLGKVLTKFKKNSRIIVFSHRPLFPLNPAWDWWTVDGDKAIALLKPYTNVSVLYGHIHQINHFNSDQIKFDSAQGLMYPLPVSGSVPKKAPIPWDASSPYKGLGFRTIEVKEAQSDLMITEYSITASQTGENVQSPVVIKVTAKRFEYSPSVIKVKKGVPAVIEFTSLDVTHGFRCPGLGLTARIDPGKPTRVSFTPERAGTFDFACNIFCGEGHSDMTGMIIVEE
ncbi:MAG TPA: metallophosphoesterase [Spirochaetota bacterium]